MLIQSLSGGLGNQMSQYAASKALSSRLKTEIFYDTSWFSDNIHHQGLELDRVFSVELIHAKNNHFSAIYPGYVNNFSFKKGIHPLEKVYF